MSHAADQRRAFIVLMLGAATIGVAPIAVRFALGAGVGPAATGFWRVLFALPPLYALTWAEGARVRLARPPGAMALVAGLMFAGDLAFWHYSLRYTSVANATMLPNMTPILVTAFAWLVLKERPAPVFLVGMAAAVAGAAAMALAESSAPGLNPHLGDALAAATAVWYAAYLLAVRAARQTLSAGGLMFWSSLVSAPGLLLAAVAMGEPLIPASLAGWTPLLGLGVIHVAGQGMIAWALGRLPAPIAAVVALVQPVVAAALGWLVFAEAISLPQALGGLLVLAGVGLAQVAATRAPAASR